MSSSRIPVTRPGGKVASVLLTAVAVALALGSSTTAYANDLSQRPDVRNATLQDDVTNQDSDSDGLTDREEIQLYGTNPLHPDSDRDGVTDSDEVLALRSNPMHADTDGDGLTDGDEARFGTGVLVADTDGDGLMDGVEIALGADPLVSDSDEDTLADGVEVRQLGTSPVSTDSDGDGLADVDEVTLYATNPAKADPIQLFTFTPGAADGRVSTAPTAEAGMRPIQILTSSQLQTVSRVPLLPTTSTRAMTILN